MSATITAEQPTTQVSCTMAGCVGCRWCHFERVGRAKYRLEFRLPVTKQIARLIYRRAKWLN